MPALVRRFAAFSGRLNPDRFVVPSVLGFMVAEGAMLSSVAREMVFEFVSSVYILYCYLSNDYSSVDAGNQLALKLMVQYA